MNKFLFLSLAVYAFFSSGLAHGGWWSRKEPIKEASYWTVREWFNKGTPVNWNQIRGTYAGRCYSFEAGSAPIGALLTYVEEGSGWRWSRSKAFPKVFAPLFGVDQTTDTGDNASWGMIRQAKETLAQADGAYLQFKEDPTVSMAIDIDQNGRMDFVEEYRKYGLDFVSIKTLQVTQKMHLLGMKSARKVKAGEVVYACFYSRKLAD
jgi:hypothetical protein